MVKPCSPGHGGSYGRDHFILPGKFAEIFSELGREALPRLFQFPGLRVKFSYTVVHIRALLGIRAALPLFRYNMQQNRLAHILCPAQNRLQLVHIMTVHRTKIVKAHLTEGISRQQSGFQPLFELMVKTVKPRKLAENFPVPALEADIAGLHTHILQKPCHAAHIFVDGHVVVVEDNDHWLAAGGGIGQPLIGKAASKGAVANNGSHVIAFSGKGPGSRHAQSYRHGIGRVPGDKSVVVFFIGLGKAGKPAVLAQGGKCIFPAGDNFMGIALMSYVKNDSVIDGIIHTVQSNRQLHRTQIGRKMAACTGYVFYNE